MKSLWTLPVSSAIVAFVSSCVLAPLVCKMAEARGLLSDPKEVRFYTSRKPLLGHLVLFVGFFLPLAIIFGFRLLSDDGYYSLAEMQRFSIGLFLASLFLTISATYSDVRNDAGNFEWLYIMASSVLLYFFDIRFGELNIPFLGYVDLHSWGLPVLVIWVLLVVSIVELLDFLEGLASAIIMIVSLIYFYLNITSGKGEVFVPLFFAILGGAAGGFIPYQLFQKKILYGKSGNKVVGFIFAAGTVIARRKETTGQFILFPIAILLFFIVVTIVLFLERQLYPYPGVGKKSSPVKRAEKP